MAAKKPKFQSRSASVSSVVEDALSDLQSLGEECQESFDNVPESLQQTSRNQTLQETAQTLCDIDIYIEVPECVSEVTVEWLESIAKNKSRSKRRDDCTSALRAVIDAVQSVAGTLQEQIDIDSGDDTEDSDEEDERKTKIEEIEEFVSLLEQEIDKAENAEFPGMFG